MPCGASDLYRTLTQTFSCDSRKWIAKHLILRVEQQLFARTGTSEDCLDKVNRQSQTWPPAPGGYSQKNWDRVCGSLSQTFTLFETELCDFSYSGYDLTIIPYLRLCLWINITFETCFKISSLVQTDVKGILKGFCCWSYRIITRK